jgi:uncharacterized membrane protein
MKKLTDVTGIDRNKLNDSTYVSNFFIALTDITSPEFQGLPDPDKEIITDIKNTVDNNYVMRIINKYLSPPSAEQKLGDFYCYKYYGFPVLFNKNVMTSAKCGQLITSWNNAHSTEIKKSLNYVDLRLIRIMLSDSLDQLYTTDNARRTPLCYAILSFNYDLVKYVVLYLMHRKLLATFRYQFVKYVRKTVNDLKAILQLKSLKLPNDIGFLKEVTLWFFATLATNGVAYTPDELIPPNLNPADAPPDIKLKTLIHTDEIKYADNDNITNFVKDTLQDANRIDTMSAQDKYKIVAFVHIVDFLKFHNLIGQLL